MAAFLDLPDEVLVCIATHLEISDILGLRKVCRRCFHLTCERSIWETTLHAQSRTYPLPRSQDFTNNLLHIDPNDFEALATSVYITASSWLRRRAETQCLQPDPFPSFTSSSSLAGLDHRTIQDMHMLADRWLVVVFQEGCYEVWDLYPSEDNSGRTGLSSNGAWARERARPVCMIRDKVHGAFISSAACVDPQDDAIILALSSQPVIMILKIDVKERPFQAQILASVGTTPFSIYIMRAINPTSKLLVFGFAMNLHFWHWPTNSYWEIKLDEAEEEIYNMILAAHFLTPQHLVCLLNSSVELVTIDFLQEVEGLPPSQVNKTLRIDVLDFRGRRNPTSIRIFNPNPVELVNARGAVFSESQSTHSKSVSTIKTTFLAYNVLRGLFHYAVEARFPTSKPGRPSTSFARASATSDDIYCPPLDLSIKLLGAHRMARYIPPTDVGDAHVPRSRFMPGPRGFIAACTLGAQGMRGVWVERHRGTMGRSVFGFARVDYSDTDEDDTIRPGNQPDGRHTTIQGACIHDMKSSYDLRGACSLLFF
ncbi:hypothetical protein BDY19DRAFT_390545 [Irpex rosettiformis]|uniref:Uncharacterized protein n=1 Tax=Irpex rosettiformis TaxID=378272 RepID=A0ACB8TUK1_9APHY|nr:hypothetical protein BDY19DRAFT_390545 [Irpex rosettiformis]